jgi:hypothetical protein
MVSPIQKQQSILQSSMAERIQQVQQQHPDMQQRYFEIQLREERKKMLQKVKNTEDAEGVTIREEEGRKRQADDHGEKEPEATEPDQQTTADSEDSDQHSHVDVKV